MSETDRYICIGKIIKSVGLKGEFKVFYLTDFPERFLKLKELLLYDEVRNEFYKDKEVLRIAKCSLKSKFAVLKVEGIESLNQAEVLRNFLVMIPEENRMELTGDKFYYYELIDSDFFNRGELLGKVKKIVNYGSGDLFCISIRDDEILIPIRKEFIKKIDIHNKRIDADLIEGFW